MHIVTFFTTAPKNSMTLIPLSQKEILCFVAGFEFLEITALVWQDEKTRSDSFGLVRTRSD